MPFLCVQVERRPPTSLAAPLPPSVPSTSPSQPPSRMLRKYEYLNFIAVQDMQEIQMDVGYFLDSCWFFLKESLLLEALDAVIKHLWESFETWKPKFSDLGSVQAVRIAVTFLVIAPVGSNSMSVILN
ncbi:hypothetical protein MUK42_23579 [Musa troglodytarum]|uniref:Uncharacterized protein n=1 Tax=Musa troglodytarum TaxID=320322 RepID=A0A9E7K8L2_9LILI|nr:hypothetical protein MUK42_23579 [Musa troglodytarum]